MGKVKKVFPGESEESRGGGLKTHKTGRSLVGELLKSLSVGELLTSVQEVVLEVEVM